MGWRPGHRVIPILCPGCRTSTMEGYRIPSMVEYRTSTMASMVMGSVRVPTTAQAVPRDVSLTMPCQGRSLLSP